MVRDFERLGVTTVILPGLTEATLVSGNLSCPCLYL
jgi:hypothetical protein